jgi:MoaA/NifB/PqqE/SkfB family radical SAM enzyme
MNENLSSENFQCRLPEKFYKKHDLDSMFLNKKIYIWGAGRDGKAMFRAIKRNGYQVEAFLDRSPVLWTSGGWGGGGIPILNPDSVLTGNKEFSENAFIVVAVSKEIDRVAERLTAEGFTEGRNFIRRTDLSPATPSIDISGVCNLRCLACPRSDTLHPFESGGFISVENYRKVIIKLLNELPTLHMVALYIWGDPLLHPKLPEILKINSDLGIGCDISTNLNIQTERLEEIVKADPTYIRLSCSGYGSRNYEVTHAGAKWDVFYKNCVELSRLLTKYNSDTGVELYFHVNKENASEYKDILDMGRELGFRVRACLSLCFPQYAMNYVENIPLPESAKKAMDLMLIHIDDMLAAARKEQQKLCFIRVAFPNINWDMSVLTCCNFNQDRIARNYLDTNMDELIKLKNASELCKKCTTHSIHRYYNIPKYNSQYIKKWLLEKYNLPFYV